MNPPISLGYSPCPNDTFIFHALAHGKIPLGDLRFSVEHHDVQILNDFARAGRLDVTKVSMHAMGLIRDRYVLLRTGGALGRGCGPLLVAREVVDPLHLAGKTIALPGALTTAALLFRLAYPQLQGNVTMMPFHRILSAVRDGEVAAGVIIHESRFTFPAYGLVQIADFGQWWESTTGLPLPLGGIAARRELGDTLLCRIEEAIGRSVDYAWAHPADSQAYVKHHAQESEEQVIRDHIALYVNGFTQNLGRDGTRAVEELLRRGEALSIFPGSGPSLFPSCENS